MKVAVVQFAPVFGDREKNFQRIETFVKSADAELVVLPELCTTGYQFDSKEEVAELCEPIPRGPTVQRLIQLCRKERCALVAGLGEEEGESYYNASVLINASGYIGRYRKIHLFGEEKKWFQPGSLGFPVWDVEGVQIGMMICFDWIFPESARSLAFAGAEIICHPANLVLPYCQEAMITRSLENGVFTVTANRVGWEERGNRARLTFTGRSQIVDPKGQRLFYLGETVQGVQAIEIDPEIAMHKNVTPENNLWEDRRPEFYGNEPL